MFKDRAEAAELLAGKLAAYHNTDSIVLAIPRGGVPIGRIIADALNLPLDIVLSKKIGHPSNPEFAIGSVTMDDVITDDYAGISEEYIQEKTAEIRTQLAQRAKLFRGNKPEPVVSGKNVILVDDGIATGNTLLATIRMLRRKDPKKLIVAVPVAPLSSSRNIAHLADEFICPEQSDYFPGVGAFYKDFRQVSDEEVIELLQASH